MEYCSSGSPSDQLVAFLNKLPELTRENDIEILFVGSDADPKYNALQEEIINEFAKYIDYSQINVAKITPQAVIYCNDLSHI